jgi:hypothetical protein
MATRTPYVHSPEEGTAEAADVPWIISCSGKCRSRRSRRLRWRQVSPNLWWGEGVASPDDEMFGKLHVAFLNPPEGMR